MEIVNSLVDLGWSFRKDSAGPNCLYISRDGEVLEAICQFKKTSSCEILSLALGCCLDEFDELAEKIYGRKRPRLYLSQGKIKKTAEIISDEDVLGLDKEAKAWWGDQDNSLQIKKWSERAPIGGLNQFIHISALAFWGDFNRLMDYRESFISGKSSYFVPMITEDMLARAVDVAVYRA